MKFYILDTNDCHPFSTDFRNDQFSTRFFDNRKKNIFKTVDSILFSAIKPFRSQFKKPSKKNTKTFLQQSVILNYTDSTKTADGIDKKNHKMMNQFILIYL